jgi:acetoin:2,6-dichlorophenolindophenol oxidoreductase subunit beta
MTTTTSFAAAFVEALHDGLSADPRASIIGGYVLGLGPERTLMDRIRRDFPGRVIDPPTSEAAVAALGTGAAMAGARPFVDLGTASFSYLAWSQMVNEAAVAHYMSGGRLAVPVTFHYLHGVRGAGAAQHSASPHAMLANAPGLEIVAPSTPADAYGLVRGAMESPNPTLIVNHARLLGIEAALPEERSALPFGRADIKRPGRDVTVLAISLMVHHALAAAERLERDGIAVEVIDPRTLVPFDEATLLSSVAKTRRLVVVDEAPLNGGLASSIAGLVAERGFWSLKAPIMRVARADTPVPYSPPLEKFVTPDADKIEAAVRRCLAERAPSGARNG